MPLTRKIRVEGNSIVVTIPSQIVEAYGIKHGDLLEITPLEQGTILMKKLPQTGTEGLL
ncbi:MAG: AbrB/MazE/SpoVT family DNA-binding domain-containing protein [Candidatus Thermoplasmatota archaeon]|nr:AbrB/MazE/SpoVT family DNA-binding domain-containing protein [Candidatus Thermoplasmatota archaeon]